MEKNDSRQNLVKAVTNYANAELDPLSELYTLKQAVDVMQARIKEIKPDAILMAKKMLHAETPKRESGSFVYNDKRFELSKEEVIDFVEHAPRYTMEDGVQYRKLAIEQTQLDKQSQAKTKLMKAIKDNFIADRPNWVPDDIVYILKCK